MNKFMLGLLTFSALGFMSLPAVAGDRVEIQEVEGINYITGNGNRAENRIYTNDIDYRTGSTNGNEGRVERLRGIIDIVGNGNDASSIIERHQTRVNQR
jgi:hypothetical protein